MYICVYVWLGKSERLSGHTIGKGDRSIVHRTMIYCCDFIINSTYIFFHFNNIAIRDMTNLLNKLIDSMRPVLCFRLLIYIIWFCFELVTKEKRCHGCGTVISSWVVEYIRYISIHIYIYNQLFLFRMQRLEMPRFVYNLSNVSKF